MKFKELREKLEIFWGLEARPLEQEEYYHREIFPPLSEALLGGEKKFIRQLIRVMEQKEKGQKSQKRTGRGRSGLG